MAFTYFTRCLLPFAFLSFRPFAPSSFRPFALLPLYLFTLFLVPCTLNAQNFHALFIGNSYTEQNNLPQIINQLANSQGDTLFYDSNTPGGCTFQQHCSNVSMTKIKQGGWDFVVLQEQSQIPSFPINYVQNNCFPYAKRLCDSSKKYNECGHNLFYMTWGRKFGDHENAATNPPVGTYEGMDDLLYERYMTMANDNQALVSPVGRVWRYIRDNKMDIELYQTDNSHPSYAGSYAAACSFYAIMFQKDPTQLSFYGSLTETIAKQIQEVAKIVVYDSLHVWNVGVLDTLPKAAFDYYEPIVDAGLIQFENKSENCTSYFWEFGDGCYSTDENPLHHYPIPNYYLVKLFCYNECSLMDSISHWVLPTSNISDIEKGNSILVYPNPADTFLQVDFLNNDVEMPLRYEIYSLQGVMVCSGQIKSNSEQIPISTLSSANYLIRITNNNKEVYSTIFIKK